MSDQSTREDLSNSQLERCQLCIDVTHDKRHRLTEQSTVINNKIAVCVCVPMKWAEKINFLWVFMRHDKSIDSRGLSATAELLVFLIQ